MNVKGEMKGQEIAREMKRDSMKALNASLGWTPLHCMVENENFDSVKQLIGENSDVNAFDNFNRTPLSIAASKGNLEIVQHLLAQGAEVNRGFPLHFSCENGHSTTALHLIKNGANVSLQKDQSYPIIIASAKGHLELVKILVAHGANVHVVDEDEETALHWACETGNTELMAFLIDAGCDIDAKDRFNLTPLSICLVRMEKRPDLVKLLMEKGASVNVLDNQKGTYLHDVEHPESALELIKYGANVNAQNDDKETPLYSLTYKEETDCAKTLLKCGADPNIQASEGWTPLHVAARRGNLDYVDELLKMNANVNLASAQNILPLHLAFGHLEIVQKLLDRGSLIDVPVVDLLDINSYRPYFVDLESFLDGTTPLSLAVINHHTEVCKLLSTYGASTSNFPSLSKELASLDATKKQIIDDWPCNSLITAVRENNLEKINTLSAEEIVSTSDLIGWSLLHHSVSQGLYEMSQLIISKGVSINVLDNYERTPLTLASARNDLKIVKLLLDTGADVNVGLPLHYAVNTNSIDCIQELINHNCDINIKNKKTSESSVLIEAAADSKSEIVKLLLKNNADPNCVNQWGETPLHHSCRFGDAESVAALIEYGANINTVDSFKDTPLSVATVSSNIDVIRLLLDHQVNIDVLDDSGETPLHPACCTNFTECVQELIKAGISVNSPNKRQQTPLFFASENLRILKTLIDNGADVNHVSFGGWTPLHESAYDGNVHCVKMLLDHDANVNRASAENVLPIYLASIRGYDEIAQELIKHGSDIDSAILDVGVLILDHGVFSWRERYHIVHGNTPLIGAASKGHLEVVKVLCAHGAVLEAVNVNGNTALHEAVLNNSESVVEFLLGFGVNPKLMNKDQKTPLDLANEVANETIVNFITKRVSVQ